MAPNTEDGKKDRSHIFPTKEYYRSRHRYDAELIAELVMKKKVPMMVRHGIAAIWEGTRRVMKKTSSGTWRTKQRVRFHSPVTKTKQGFIDAFNIIMASFRNYDFISEASTNLTGHGQEQNRLHQRETDSIRRTMLFNRIFQKYFKEEIEAYKLKVGVIK